MKINYTKKIIIIKNLILALKIYQNNITYVN